MVPKFPMVPIGNKLCLKEKQEGPPKIKFDPAKHLIMYVSLSITSPTEVPKVGLDKESELFRV